MLEGPLRVNWGVQSAIQFKKKDDDNEGQTPETPKHWRKSYKLAINNGLNDADPEVCDQLLSSFPLLIMKLFLIKQIRKAITDTEMLSCVFRVLKFIHNILLLFVALSRAMMQLFGIDL